MMARCSGAWWAGCAAVAIGSSTLLVAVQGCGSGSGGSGTGWGGSSSGGGSGSSSGGSGSGGNSSSSGASSGSGSGVSSGGSSSSSSGSGSSGSSSGGSSGSSGGMMGNPPFGGSSKGSSGGPANGDTEQAGGVTYQLIIPGNPQTPMPLCIVYSGTEGGAQMTMNLQAVAPMVGADGIAFAVLDGVNYNGDGSAGATVLDDVRSKYDVDNDRTYLLGESAGTTAAEQLGFHLRESYFAAYWANDINASDGPGQTAAQIGFAPWGQVGPGGDFPDAMSVVSAMQTAGYRLPNPAPYNGPGAGTHGDPNQFIAAVSFFPGKTRQ